jgi:hypothetical protein
MRARALAGAAKRHALITVGVDLAAIKALLCQRIGEEIESSGGPLEPLLGALIPRADIRVQFFSQRAIGAPDFVSGGGPADA